MFKKFSLNVDFIITCYFIWKPESKCINQVSGTNNFGNDLLIFWFRLLKRNGFTLIWETGVWTICWISYLPWNFRMLGILCIISFVLFRIWYLYGDYFKKWKVWNFVILRTGNDIMTRCFGVSMIWTLTKWFPWEGSLTKVVANGDDVSLGAHWWEPQLAGVLLAQYV